MDLYMSYKLSKEIKNNKPYLNIEINPTETEINPTEISQSLLPSQLRIRGSLNYLFKNITGQNDRCKSCINCGQPVIWCTCHL